MAKKGKQKRRNRKKSDQAALGMSEAFTEALIAQLKMAPWFPVETGTPWTGGVFPVPLPTGALEAHEKMKAEKLEQAKAAEAAIAFQIQAQVDMWKTEVEGGNHLIGMMLSEVHPKIVTYEVEREGKLLPLPAFTWADPEKAQEDEELRKRSGSA